MPHDAALDARPNTVAPDITLAESTVLLARQPIFDRKLQVWGYELLYRSGNANQYDINEPSGRATARTIVNALLNIGLDDLVGSKLAFINFDREMLLSEFAWTLPREKVVIEILETVAADPEIVAICSAARKRGFKLALDDVDESAYGNPMADLVDILKVDFRATSNAAREKLARRYGGGRTTLLAEKVETEEEFHQATSLGFQYVQGYFFARPALVSGRPLPVAAVSLLRILGQLSDPDLSVKQLEAAVRQQVSLAHKLIRYMNSAAFVWKSPIQSIQHALALLGTEQLRKIVSLMIIADLSGSGPKELLVKALLRARMAELVSPAFGLEDRSGTLFLMGLFSLLDVILARPMEEILSGLNLEAEICDVLLARSPKDNPIRRLHELVIAYEVADWPAVVTQMGHTRVDLNEISAFHRQAVRWADEVSRL